VPPGSRMQYPLRLLLNSSTCWLKVVPTEMGSVGHLESLDWIDDGWFNKTMQVFALFAGSRTRSNLQMAPIGDRLGIQMAESGLEATRAPLT
jgi:hypothetical protein